MDRKSQFSLLILICIFGLLFLFILSDNILDFNPAGVSKNFLSETVSTELGNSELKVPVCNTTFVSRTGNSTIYVNLTVPSWAYLHEHIHTNLPGGHYRPTTCSPQYKVAIIVPYMDRDKNLRCFLQHMHPYLQRQRVEYKIFVVELVPWITFNRAILMNIGFVESIKSDNFSCFIFHDVDLLPEDIRNVYACQRRPLHMSHGHSTLNYTLPYTHFLGGVSALTRDQFERVNGFSNVYFGWGAEDDDLYTRINYHGMKVARRPIGVSKYTMLEHKPQMPSPDRNKHHSLARRRLLIDGLKSLKYQMVARADRVLFTWMLVSVNQTEILSQWPLTDAQSD